MVTTIAILVTSVGLFLYWFRYTCLLILMAQTAQDHAEQVAAANQLRFLHLQRQLDAAMPADMDRICQALQRDFEVVAYLFRHASEFAGGGTLETLMLRADYGVMHGCYRLAKVFAPTRARGPLHEMCDIVNYFANALGERAVAASVQA